MTDINKLKELVETLKPNYGEVGSRDVDVTAKRAAADGIVEALEATQQRIAEITGKYEEVSGWYAKMKTRMLAAEAELARRDAAAGEPDGYIFLHPNGKLFWSVSADSNAGQKDIKPFYFAAQPTALPPIKLPKIKHPVLFDYADELIASLKAQGFTVEEE